MNAENPLDLATYQNDHDLLIALNTEMRLLRVDIKEMKDGNSLTLHDHETRLRFLERWVWGAIAIVGAAEVLFKLFWK